jgi:hypothetical protein
MSDPTPAAAPGPELKKCKCGFDRNHGLIRPELEYGLGSTLLLLFAGVGARARKATLFCPRCKTVLEVITDKQALSKYR